MNRCGIPMREKEVAQPVGVGLVFVADDTDGLERRRLGGLPIGQDLAHRQVQPSLGQAPGTRM
jgi:hypothetical protein